MPILPVPFDFKRIPPLSAVKQTGVVRAPQFGATLP